MNKHPPLVNNDEEHGLHVLMWEDKVRGEIRSRRPKDKVRPREVSSVTAADRMDHKHNK